MKIDPELSKATEELRLTYPNYTLESYQFVSNAVSCTIAKLASHRHISAAELLVGIRDYARERYGAVAPLVMDQLGLRTARNVGEVVYLLISVKLLSASPEDSPDDFNVAFSWEDPAEDGEPLPELPFLDAQ